VGVAPFRGGQGSEMIFIDLRQSLSASERCLGGLVVFVGRPPVLGAGREVF